jgi:hypothetical protein
VSAVYPSYDQIYQQIFHQFIPGSITVGESSAEIIRPARGFVEHFDLTMQTQVGCPAGCLFCYVPSGRLLTPGQVRGQNGENWGFEVRRKRNVLEQFAGHLQRGELADKVIYWSGVTDPYATPAAETRAIWDQLNAAPARQRPMRLIVQTRFRPDRDVERMAAYARSTTAADAGPPVVISYSIGTDQDSLIRAWERATPLSAQRMKAIETLCRAGIAVVPTLSPFGLWDDLGVALERFRSWTIPYITVLFFKRGTDSANTPNHFLGYITREFPMLLDPSWQRLQLRVLRHLYGANRVLLGKPAFASLASPHLVA